MNWNRVCRSMAACAFAAGAVLMSACGSSSQPAGTQGGSGGSSSGGTACASGLSGGVVAPALPVTDINPVLALAGAQLAAMLQPTVLDCLPLQPVPQAQCDSDSQPLDNGVQGRVTLADMQSAQAAKGWTCNLKVVSQFSTPGGFRVWSYTDPQGHTCAYYDTSFAGGTTAAISLAGGPTPGVVVLDMSDPAHPAQTAQLIDSLAMLIPHESLNLNARRGLLAADVGNAATLPGEMAIYDIASDCRHPQLKGQLPTITGHESGFSPDGNTFWVAGGFGYITAVDVRDPSNPKEVWRGTYNSHGLNLSDDGNTLYHTDTISGNFGLIDVSQVQARASNPQVHDISRVSWSTATIPQNSSPFTNNGHHYLLEFEEFAFRFNPVTLQDSPGAARILNIDDPAHPSVVSNIRLAVNMQDQHRAADLDPYPLANNSALGYAFHYCAIPSEDSPQIAACSTMNSGLRVFNISDPANPREVAYYIAPPNAGSLTGSVVPGLLSGDLAFSQPAFNPAQRQIWYTDAVSGFYALQLSPQAWPQ